MNLRRYTLIASTLAVVIGAGYLLSPRALGRKLGLEIFSDKVRPGDGHEEEEEGGGEKRALIEAYQALRHRAAPGTDWQKIELANAEANDAFRHGLEANKGTAAFANGRLNGVWHERGNSNTAGRMSSFAYNANTNTLYSLSDAGTLWKMNPPNGAWSLLNDGYKLASKVLAISPISGGRDRIFMARDTQLVYTDNNGSTLQVAGGISFPVKWGANRVAKIIAVNDAMHSIYAVVTGWNSSPWGKALWIYHSSDTGKHFTSIYRSMNLDASQVDWFSPYNSRDLYALRVAASSPDSLFSLTAGTMTFLNATNSFPSTATDVVLTGLNNSGQLQLYSLLDNSQLFQSGDTGRTWNSVSTLPSDSWNLLASSTQQVGRLFYGNVEAFRSSNGGTGFTKVNTWGQYYGNEATKLHADIQAIDFFQDKLGNEFCVIGTDGGAYYSNDYLMSVANMSLSGLKVNQLWNHITDPNNPSILFSGMQDQGLCHTISAGGTGIITQKQLISGDYGHLCISGLGGILWAEYPGGVMSLYGPTLSNPSYLDGWSMKGSQLPNAGWMLPTTSIPGTSDDILIGGGNITNGAGSYLIKLSYVAGNVSATQFPFNFRAASNNGSSGLSAIGISPLNTRIAYTATEDGTFFHTGDGGTTWMKTAGFPGVKGNWLYGSCIEPSVQNPAVVYYGGSGYSNPAFWVSNDTGRTFTDKSLGLPPTLINGLAVTPNDSLVFAATDAGPYVFVTALQQWYPLIVSNTPGCVWQSVEFIPSIRTARFSTYGRGVWDFTLDAITPPNSVAGTTTSSGVVAVYPNPASAGGIVQIQGLAAKPARISLLDLNGRMLGNMQWQGSGPLRVPELPQGYYVYRIEQEGRVFMGKILIR